MKAPRHGSQPIVVLPCAFSSVTSFCNLARSSACLSPLPSSSPSSAGRGWFGIMFCGPATEAQQHEPSRTWTTIHFNRLSPVDSQDCSIQNDVPLGNIKIGEPNKAPTSKNIPFQAILQPSQLRLRRCREQWSGTQRLPIIVGFAMPLDPCALIIQCTRIAY